MSLAVFRFAVRSFLALSMGLGASFAALAMAVPPASALDVKEAQQPFWLATKQGDVWAFGANDYGNLKGRALSKPIVGMTPTPSGSGYWLVASDGGIFAFGDAQFLGSTGALSLNRPIVAMAATPTNKGYWLIASDGGIFAFGDAQFFGSTGNLALNEPIVAMAATPTNKGYWLVARDGGIFAFGDAKFFGSTGAIKLNRPIVAMAATPTSKGYWLMAADGGIFAFGDAVFAGSAGGGPDNNYASIVSTPDGAGYWLVRNGGDTVAFGTAVAGATAAGSRSGSGTGTSSPRRGLVALMFNINTPGDAAVAWAMTQLDKPYIWGGNGPDGYDCSGLTSAAWRSAGVSLNRVANDQYDNGRHVTMDELRTGDLLFWGNDLSNSRAIDHVGMYIGGGWGVNSGGTSKPSRVSTRNVSQTSSWMMQLGVRPIG